MEQVTQQVGQARIQGAAVASERLRDDRSMAQAPPDNLEWQDAQVGCKVTLSILRSDRIVPI